MSGKAAVFGFLPPHGKKLEAGEEYTFFGSIESLLSKVTSGRKRAGFTAAVQSGDLVVVSGPTPILYDATLDVSKTIKLDNNSFSTTDPFGVGFSSSI
jgi:hypothetical protein